MKKLLLIAGLLLSAACSDSRTGMIHTPNPAPAGRAERHAPICRRTHPHGPRGIHRTGDALAGEAIDPEAAKDHENLNAHSFLPKEVFNAMMERYKHPIVRDIEEKAKQVGGHGGMDFIMDYRLIYCLRNGLPLDMDVYDLAEWCCLIPLSEISLDNGSVPGRDSRLYARRMEPLRSSGVRLVIRQGLWRVIHVPSLVVKPKAVDI